MKITPMEIKSYEFKKSMRGYDPREVEVMKELAADTLEDVNRRNMYLEEKVSDLEQKLSEHISNEKTLRETLTSAQKMVEGMKANAQKEAELVLAEANVLGEEIVKQAQTRATQLQEEIARLKRQRIEMQTSIKAVIDYHSQTLLTGEEESKKADEEAEKVSVLPK